MAEKKNHHRIGSTLLVVVFSILTGGCATVYTVDVDALSNPDAYADGFSYEIVSSNPSIPTTNLQFQQARQLVRKALTSVGMYEAAEGDPPDLTIGIDFGVGMRQVNSIAQSMPSTTMSGIGPITNVPGTPHISPTTGSGGYTAYSFRKYLSIVASVGGPGTPAGGNRVELWRVETSLVDKGDNMEYYLPILAGVASEFVATDTGEKTTRRISKDDDIVDWIRQSP